MTDLHSPVAVARSVGRVFTSSAARGSSVVALDDVSFDVEAGRLTVLAGPSGSGKSTMLALLGALDRPTTGTVEVGGVDIGSLGRAARRRLRRTVAVSMLPLPADNLLGGRTGTENLHAVARLRGADAHAPAIAALLDTIGIASLVDREVGAMSGGEQQRLALACALVGAPALVLVDEPTAALDRASAATVVAALAAAAADGASLVVATHDAAVIEAADAVVRLEHGRRVG